MFSVCAWREGGREGGRCIAARARGQDKFQLRQKHNHKTSVSFSSGYFDKHFLQPTGQPAIYKNI